MRTTARRTCAALSSSSTMIAELNTRSVCLMQVGRFDEAANILLSALQQMREDIRERQQDTTMTDTNNGGNDYLVIEQTQVAKIDQGADGNNNSADASAKAMTTDQTTAFFLCCQAFLFVTEKSALTDLADTNQNKVFAILFYNLALAKHLGAMSGVRTPPRRHVLNCVLRLYDMALNVLTVGTEDADDLIAQQEDDETICALKLALINNKGHIHSEFFERTQLEHCLNYMEFLLDSYLEWETDCDGSKLDRCSQFHLNILLFSRSKNIQSAAAA